MSERGAASFGEQEGGGLAEKGGRPSFSLEGIDNSLFTDTDQVLKAATLSGEEVDSMLRERLKSIGALRENYEGRDERLKRAEFFNPLAGLKPSDYDRFVKEQLIDAASGEYLKKLDAAIEKSEANEDPTPDILSQLEKLRVKRHGMQKQLEHFIEEKQKEIDARREVARQSVIGHYGDRITRLEGTIAEIEHNPLVRDRLHTQALAEDKTRSATKEKEERARREVQDKIDKEVPRTLQSIGDKHKNAFHRIGELIGNPDIGEQLRVAMEKLQEVKDTEKAATSPEDKRKVAEELRKADRVIYNLINETRKRLIEAVLEGEGAAQLKQPSEVVPWEVRSSNAYYPAITFLQSKEVRERMDGLLNEGKPVPWIELYVHVRSENESLKWLFGGKFVKDKKTGKRTDKLTDFYQAFEKRKENDTAGVTDARKAEREALAKGKAEFDKNMVEIVARGGFPVKGQRGVVRLERVKGDKKGTDLWEVAEVYGETGTLKVTDRSVLSMRGFPNWVREAARLFFITRGQDLVERLQYGPEDQEKEKK
ncbi:MAG: hypothetical protein Q7S16_04370 [bacterium]|nr:hypothetical protein [bacterium]